jgi:hypothetical protein
MKATAEGTVTSGSMRTCMPEVSPTCGLCWAAYRHSCGRIGPRYRQSSPLSRDAKPNVIVPTLAVYRVERCLDILRRHVGQNVMYLLEDEATSRPQNAYLLCDMPPECATSSGARSLLQKGEVRKRVPLGQRLTRRRKPNGCPSQFRIRTRCPYPDCSSLILPAAPTQIAPRSSWRAWLNHGPQRTKVNPVRRSYN